MKYEIKGTPLPVVECHLEPGESVSCESGGMSWMSPNMRMNTNAGGSIGKAFSRMFSGESMFQNVYTAEGGAGMIAFASCFPGEIIPMEITPDKPVIAQKSAFLAASEGVEMSIHFQKKLGSGFFGGEGFIMQKLSGNGTVFLEIDGSVLCYDLAPNQSMILDTGHLAIMEHTVSIDVQTVKGVGNVLFGGEGLFNTRVTGPGKIWIQTMPASTVAGALSPYLSTGNK